MPAAEQPVDVNVGVTTAYDQWARFESFPRWMEGVASVDQIDDTRLHWVAKVKDEVATGENETREWDADHRADPRHANLLGERRRGAR